MEHPDNIELEKPVDDAEEEALSSPEFFFTVSDSNTFMCSAEDIIISGELLPFPCIQSHPNVNRDEDDVIVEKKRRAFRQPRSDSSPEFETSEKRSDGAELLARNIRSLDRGDRKPNNRCSSDCSMVSELLLLPDSSLLKKAAKQRRRSVMMFGLARVPTEMDLADIKYRQLQRTPSNFFPRLDAKGKLLLPKQSPGSGKQSWSWKLLHALSCINHSAAAVKASLRAPQTY